MKGYATLFLSIGVILSLMSIGIALVTEQGVGLSQLL